MIVTECINKLPGPNGEISNYILKGMNGKNLMLSPETLKIHILEGKIHVINLKLTSDNRLIDGDNSANIEDIETDKLISKARVLGLGVFRLMTPGGDTCYLIKNNTTKQYILKIPSISNFMNTQLDGNYNKEITDARTLKVIGGENVRNAEFLFANLQLKNLDLTEFRPNIIENAFGIFDRCVVDRIDLSTITFSPKISIGQLINKCGCKEIVLYNHTLDIENILKKGLLNPNITNMYLDKQEYERVIAYTIKFINQRASRRKLDLQVIANIDEKTEIRLSSDNKVKVIETLDNSEAIVSLITLYITLKTIEPDRLHKMLD